MFVISGSGRFRRIAVVVRVIRPSAGLCRRRPGLVAGAGAVNGVADALKTGLGEQQEVPRAISRLIAV